MPDKRYSEPMCECGDPFCAGCDDPQIDADLSDRGAMTDNPETRTQMAEDIRRDRLRGYQGRN